MKARRILGVLLVVVVVVATIWVIIFTSHSHASKPVTSATSPRPSPQVSLSSSPSIAKPKSAQLNEQISAFIQAYFLFTSGDTTATRLQRIMAIDQPPFIQKGTLAALTQQLKPDAEDTRIAAHHQATSGQVANVTLDFQPVKPGDKTNVYVIVPVIKTITASDGKVVNQIQVLTDFVWKYHAGQWTMTHFVEGSDLD